MQIFEIVMSDWGILIFIMASFWLLVVGAYLLLLSGDTMSVKKLTPTSTGMAKVLKEFSIVGGKKYKWPFIIFGLVLVLCSWAGLSFWGQVNTGVPYIPNADVNLWFIAMIGVLIASMFMMAIVFLKGYAITKT